MLQLTPEHLKLLTDPSEPVYHEKKVALVNSILQQERFHQTELITCSEGSVFGLIAFNDISTLDEFIAQADAQDIDIAIKQCFYRYYDWNVWDSYYDETEFYCGIDASEHALEDNPNVIIMWEKDQLIEHIQNEQAEQGITEQQTVKLIKQAQAITITPEVHFIAWDAKEKTFFYGARHEMLYRDSYDNHYAVGCLIDVLTKEGDP